MKNFFYKYRKIIRISLVIPLMVFFISYGCQKNDDDQTTAQMNYSGEEIFRGIFFSEGELPNQIDALKAEHEKSEALSIANKSVKEFKLDFSDEIVNSINELDPEFFNNFKKQMESKNYYAIQLAMTNAAKMVKAGGYRSKYAGFFKLSDELESKKVDLSSKEFTDIDVSTPEGLVKYKSLIKDKYNINVDDDEYKVGCVTVFYAIAGVVSIAAAAYSVVGVAVYAVYSKVEFWGGATNQDAVGNVLVEELALKLGSS